MPPSKDWKFQKSFSLYNLIVCFWFQLSLSNLLGDGRGSDKDDGHLKKLQHSSGRKKLPTVPTQEEQSNMKESIRLRSPVNTDHLAAYGQFFLEYSMLAELWVLVQGMYIITCNVVWFVLVNGRKKDCVKR